MVVEATWQILPPDRFFASCLGRFNSSGHLVLAHSVFTIRKKLSHESDQAQQDLSKRGWLYGMEMDFHKSRILDGVLAQKQNLRAGVSNCMHQCLNFLVLNVHIPAYLGSRGKPFFLNFEVFLLCLPIVDQYKFVY